MNNGTISRRTVLAGVPAALIAPGAARAQDAYPNRPIKFIVPYTPAGATDNISRIMMAKVSELLGQQILIDNRAGGGGTIGTDAIAKAAPDVPAIDEFVPGYVVEVWMGFGGPAGIPAPIVEKLAAVADKSLQDPEVKAKFAALGADPWPMTPKALGDRVVSEIAVWAPIVKASGAKVDG